MALEAFEVLEVCSVVAEKPRLLVVDCVVKMVADCRVGMHCKVYFEDSESRDWNLNS